MNLVGYKDDYLDGYCHAAKQSEILFVSVIGPICASVIQCGNCLEQCFSNCGPRRSAGGFGRKSIAKLVSDTERMKNTPIPVRAKTAFVG
jgi:hypothetical protein